MKGAGRLILVCKRRESCPPLSLSSQYLAYFLLICSSGIPIISPWRSIPDTNFDPVGLISTTSASFL